VLTRSPACPPLPPQLPPNQQERTQRGAHVAAPLAARPTSCRPARAGRQSYHLPLLLFVPHPFLHSPLRETAAFLDFSLARVFSFSETFFVFGKARENVPGCSSRDVFAEGEARHARARGAGVGGGPLTGPRRCTRGRCWCRPEARDGPLRVGRRSGGRAEESGMGRGDGEVRERRCGGGAPGAAGGKRTWAALPCARRQWGCRARPACVEYRMRCWSPRGVCSLAIAAARPGRGRNTLRQQ